MNSHALKDDLHATCTDNPTERVEVLGKFEDPCTEENYLQATRIMFTRYSLPPPAITQERDMTRWIRE